MPISVILKLATQVFVERFKVQDETLVTIGTLNVSVPADDRTIGIIVVIDIEPDADIAEVIPR